MQIYIDILHCFFVKYISVFVHFIHHTLPKGYQASMWSGHYRLPRSGSTAVAKTRDPKAEPASDETWIEDQRSQLGRFKSDQIVCMFAFGMLRFGLNFS